MLNPRALAVAIVATGAGAVLFLSIGQNPTSPVSGGFGPVPVAIPPAVTEIPRAHPAAPAAQRVAPPSSTSPTPSTPSAAPRPAAASTPVRTTPPPAARVAQAPPARQAPAQQQPRPASVEPNGTGGWQLPACYEVSCAAESEVETQAAPADSTPGLLGSTLGTLGGVVTGLLGGH